jgi:hypothetical protein
MYICYLDESGGYEAPDRSPDATPVMVILGLVVNAASVPALTRDFLALKRRHFPARYASPHALDHILVEVKGSEILQMTRKSSRNPRRQAQRLRAELLDLVEAHGCRIVARVWVKEPGKGMAPVPSYCYAIQDIARHFSQYNFGPRIRGLQYRYRDETGRWRGGLVVSDPAQQRSGATLFGP